MEVNLISQNEPWYWFITSIMKCDQASAIRCFLAPIYLPYINGGKRNFVNVQKEWLEYYEDKVTEINFDNPDIPIDEDNTKNRLKYIGTYLCETVEEERGIECFKYLGKNRNVSFFPERFIYSIFPVDTSKGVFEELWSYYYQLLSQVFYNNVSCLDEILDNLETINKKTKYFQVPGILSESDDELVQKIERVAYLLCAFCVLNSALKVKHDAKNGLLLNEGNNIFKKAQIFLEIEVENPDKNESNGVSVSYEELLLLNMNAIGIKNIALLQIIDQINKNNATALFQKGKDRFHIKELINKTKTTERQLINMMNEHQYEISEGAQELVVLTEIEKFWKEVYDRQ